MPRQTRRLAAPDRRDPCHSRRRAQFAGAPPVGSELHQQRRHALGCVIAPTRQQRVVRRRLRVVVAAHFAGGSRSAHQPAVVCTSHKPRKGQAGRVSTGRRPTRHDRGVIEHFDEAWRELTADGAGFAMAEIEVRGAPMRVFKSAPPTMRAIWELAATARRQAVHRVRGRVATPTPRSAPRCVRSPHHLPRRHGVGPRRPRRDRDAQLPGVGRSRYWATVVDRRGRRRHQRLVDEPEMEYGLADSRPKVLIADDERVERVLPGARRAARRRHRCSIIAVRSERDLPDDAARWTDVVDPEPRPTTLPDADDRPRRRRHDLLHVGHDRLPEGRPAHPPRLGAQHPQHRLHDDAARRWPRRRRSPPASLPAPDAAPARAPAPAVFMAPTPLFHVTANNCVLHPCTLIGGKIVFMRKWDAGRALELIERERVTNFSGVPTMSRELLLHPDWAKRDTSSLQDDGRRRRTAPARPRRQDRQVARERCAVDRLRADRDARHRHRQRVAALPRQAGVVRAGRADARRQAGRRARRRPAGRPRT